MEEVLIQHAARGVPLGELPGKLARSRRRTRGGCVTVLTAQRLPVFASTFEHLVDKDVFHSWFALSITGRRAYEKLGAPYRRHLRNVVFATTGKYKTERAARRYLMEVGDRYPAFDFGRSLAAEKRVETYFPGRLVDFANMVAYAEEELDRRQPGCLISDYPASALDMAVYQICLSKGLLTLFTMVARLPENRILLFERPEECRSELVLHYQQEFRTRGLGVEDRRRAEEFLSDFRTRRPKPSYFGLSRDRARSERLRSFVAYMRSPGGGLRRLGRAARKVRLERGWSEVFSSLDAEDDIVFFPIQYQPEASTYVMSPFFRDQFAVVRNLCFSLPPRYTLLVKEHPRHIEAQRRSLEFYRGMLARLPNLKFVDPDTDSHEIIRNAKAVVVLSSTVGWEAFLYEVPVIQLGVSEYSYFDGIHQVSSFVELRDRLGTLIEAGAPDHEDVLRAVAAMFRGTSPGLISEPAWDPSVTEPENVRDVAAALRRGIDFHRGRSANRPAHSV